MTRLDDVASKDITADQITGEDAPAPAPAPGSVPKQMPTSCYEGGHLAGYGTDLAMEGKSSDCSFMKFAPATDWATFGDGSYDDSWILCLFPEGVHAAPGCQQAHCSSPEVCAREGGENLGQPKNHDGALAWSTGFAAVTVAASTVAFL